MSILPIRASDLAPSSRAVARASRLHEKTDLDVFTHQQQARYLAECDQIDSAAVADALTFSFQEECRLLDAGLAAASGSPAKAELLARKLELLANANNRRIQRRFGS